MNLSLQPLRRKGVTLKVRREFVNQLDCRALKESFKEFSKTFGSLGMMFTFAAAKSERVQIK